MAGRDDGVAVVDGAAAKVGPAAEEIPRLQRHLEGNAVAGNGQTADDHGSSQPLLDIDRNAEST